MSIMQTTLREKGPYRDLSDLTRQYARYARNAAGLGNILGGVLTMAMYIVGLTLPLTAAGRVGLALVPLVWIAAKEMLRRAYYQRHGRVTEVPSAEERRWHVILTGITALISLFILGSFFLGGRAGPAEASPWQQAGYLAFVLALPVLVWFFMRTTEEYLVGVLLVCQAAVLLAGGNYPLSWQNAYFPLFAAFAVVAGFRQHRAYLKLERQLRNLGGR